MAVMRVLSAGPAALALALRLAVPAIAATTLVLGAATADAAPAAGKKAKPKGSNKRYLFSPDKVVLSAKAGDEVGKTAQARLGPQLATAIGEHPRLVAVLTGAPDPSADPKGFDRALKAQKRAGGYRVTVEVSEASEEIEELDGRPGQLRLVVRLSLHMFGETLPRRTMGFSGEGSATIKVDVGKKVRPRDREYAWDSAGAQAVRDALAASLDKLGVPLPPPTTK